VNPSTAFGAVLADELARCGLREVVIAPGSRSAPLAMAFDQLDRAARQLARLQSTLDAFIDAAPMLRRIPPNPGEHR